MPYHHQTYLAWNGGRREEDAEATHETFIFTSPIFLPPPPPPYILPLPRIFLHIRCEIHRKKSPVFLGPFFTGLWEVDYPEKRCHDCFKSVEFRTPARPPKSLFLFFLLFLILMMCAWLVLFSLPLPLLWWCLPLAFWLKRKRAFGWRGKSLAKKRERIRKERGKEKNGCTHEIGPRIQLPFSL